MNEISTDQPADYNVKVTVRNGRLLSRLRAAGYPSMMAFCNAHGIAHSAMQRLVSLKETGMTKSDNWRKAVVLISDILKCMPEDIIPPQHWRHALKNNTAEVSMTEDQIADLAMGSSELPDANLLRGEMSDAINTMLEGLTPREERVVRLRFGIGCEEETLEECADKYGVGKERIRQIEAKALRRLKFRDKAHNKNRLHSYLRS